LDDLRRIYTRYWGGRPRLLLVPVYIEPRIVARLVGARDAATLASLAPYAGSVTVETGGDGRVSASTPVAGVEVSLSRGRTRFEADAGDAVAAAARSVDGDVVAVAADYEYRLLGDRIVDVVTAHPRLTLLAYPPADPSLAPLYARLAEHPEAASIYSGWEEAAHEAASLLDDGDGGLEEVASLTASALVVALCAAGARLESIYTRGYLAHAKRLYAYGGRGILYALGAVKEDGSPGSLIVYNALAPMVEEEEARVAAPVPN
jgi:hypothetical protein